MAYKNKDKQKEASKRAMRRYRDRKQGITEANNVIPNVIPNVILQTLTDATGRVHKIDYEGRRRMQATLDGWYEGKGTVYQQRLAILGRQYSVLKGIDRNRYLGYA